MKQPKFNFIPERQVNKTVAAGGYAVTLTKQKNLIFNKTDVNIYELDGKNVRLFVDTEKKSIAWAVIEGKTELDKLNDARQLKANPTNGSILLGVGRLLRAMGLEVKENKKFSVQTYISPLHTSKMWYIDLNSPKVEEPCS